MALYKIVNGVRMQMTPQEEADFEASRTPSLAAIKEALSTAVSAHRRVLEEGGITVGQRRIATTREFRQQMRELRDWAQDNPGQQIPVRLADGKVVRIGAAALAAAAQAIAAHVRACIEAEAAHLDAIAALPDVAAARAYDVTTGWPA